MDVLISSDAILNFKEHDIKNLFGRKVAIDASMSIYQFLIAVRQRDGEVLMNEAGETTRYIRVFDSFVDSHHLWGRSHLMGFFYRTIRIVENGIKPAYVFDGKPPELKAGVVRVLNRISPLPLPFRTRSTFGQLTVQAPVVGKTA